jgi:hypothetical protein
VHSLALHEAFFVTEALLINTSLAYTDGPALPSFCGVLPPLPSKLDSRRWLVTSLRGLAIQLEFGEKAHKMWRKRDEDLDEGAEGFNERLMSY